MATTESTRSSSCSWLGKISQSIEDFSDPYWELSTQIAGIARSTLSTISTLATHTSDALKPVITHFPWFKGISLIVTVNKIPKNVNDITTSVAQHDGPETGHLIVKTTSNFMSLADCTITMVNLSSRVAEATAVLEALGPVGTPLSMTASAINLLPNLYTAYRHYRFSQAIDRWKESTKDDVALKTLHTALTGKAEYLDANTDEVEINKRILKLILNSDLSGRICNASDVQQFKLAMREAVVLQDRKQNTNRVNIIIGLITLVAIGVLFSACPAIYPSMVLLGLAVLRLGFWIDNKFFIDKGLKPEVSDDNPILDEDPHQQPQSEIVEADRGFVDDPYNLNNGLGPDFVNIPI